MKEPAPLPFQAPPGYRRRRLIDAIRLLPFVGLLLFFLPLLWAAGVGSTALTSRGGIYIFLIWLVLIFAAAVSSRAVAREEARDDAEAADGQADG
jgi:hypothetical protein